MSNTQQKSVNDVTNRTRPRNRWQCHKVVTAEMIAGFEPREDTTLVAILLANGDRVIVDKTWSVQHAPEVGGYYVVYDDGYESYSPPKPFEEGYKLIPMNGGQPVTPTQAPMIGKAVAHDFTHSWRKDGIPICMLCGCTRGEEAATFTCSRVPLSPAHAMHIFDANYMAQTRLPGDMSDSMAGYRRATDGGFIQVLTEINDHLEHAMVLLCNAAPDGTLNPINANRWVKSRQQWLEIYRQSTQPTVKPAKSPILEMTNAAMAHNPPAYAKVERLTDELHLLARLASEPQLMNQSGLIQDAFRMALTHVHQRFVALGCDLRREAEQHTPPRAE